MPWMRRNRKTASANISAVHQCSCLTDQLKMWNVTPTHGKISPNCRIARRSGALSTADCGRWSRTADGKCGHDCRRPSLGPQQCHCLKHGLFYLNVIFILCKEIWALMSWSWEKKLSCNRYSCLNRLGRLSSWSCKIVLWIKIGSLDQNSLAAFTCCYKCNFLGEGSPPWALMEWSCWKISSPHENSLPSAQFHLVFIWSWTIIKVSKTETITKPIPPPDAFWASLRDFT